MNARWVRGVGYGILALSIFYLARRGYDNFGELSAVRPGGGFYVVLVLFCAGYGISQLLIVRALSVLISGLGGAVPSFGTVVNFHGRTNIAKYLPGNVFHYVGRQMLARKIGWSQITVGLASLGETALVALAAVATAIVFAAIGGGDGLPAWPGGARPVILIAATAGLAAVWMAGAFAASLPLVARIPGITTIQSFARGPGPLIAAGYYGLFFAINAAAFWGLALSLEGTSGSALLAPMGLVYVASWLAGYITPGAPGGVGVREAAMIFLLGPMLGEANALVLALSLRIVTTIGDLLLFLIALAVGRGAASNTP